MSRSSPPPPYPGNTESVRHILGDDKLDRTHSSSGSDDDYEPYDDEDEWELDEAQRELSGNQPRDHDQQSPELLARSILAQAQPFLPAAPAKLLYPVILPQRRPKNRERGFIRAYAPDLMRCGIDQTTFMAFLDGFDKATATSPLVSVVDLAGGVAGLLPYAIAPPVGLAVQIAAGVYRETEGRKHQNAFIVKMNEELFMPRGLYCLIMAYRPDTGKARQRQGTIAQLNIDAATGSHAGSSDRYRSNDGAMGPIEFPRSADLVFPGLEEAWRQEQQDEGSIGDGFLKAFERFKDRRDLKAQKKYLKKNPASALNPLMDPKVELTPKDREKQEKRLKKDERKREKHERKREKKARKHPERAEKEPRKRLLQKDVLYMMIINMPSTGEMENAVRLVGDGSVYENRDPRQAGPSSYR
ncbi:hypothetical protein GGR52DRAFT_146861 [Hypoxylon sp. FL1284]|nr:hypothetical protein GGR52DRAFT_146861 [Hypoxylon sp. FL1284]